MPAPFLFILIPILLMPLFYLIQRARAVSVALAVLFSVALAALALGLPFGQPVGWLGGLVVQDTATVLGRAFTVETADRLSLAFMFAQAALLYLLSAIVERRSAFLPASSGILGLLAAALFVRPFLFAAIFIELAAALAVFMLAADSPDQPRQARAQRGPLRLLVYTTLSLPFILVTGWLLEASAASPADPTFMRQATLTLMFGFAILLAVVPFHSWVPAIAQDAPPLTTAFVFTVFCQATIFLLLRFLSAYPWLNQNPTVYRALTLAGGAMALFGALFAFGQRNFGRSLGYAMLIDFGAVLLGIGLGTQAGVEAALTSLALRGIGLPLWAVGLARLRQAAGGDDFETLRGVARQHPMASAAVIFGLLSLVGFPLTAGFTGRWALVGLLAQIHPSAALLLLLGTFSLAFVCARGLVALLSPAGEQELEAPAGTATNADSSTPPAGGLRASGTPAASGRASAAVYGVGFAVVLALGVFPQWLLPAVAATASALIQLKR